jgi:hypothetical protein
MIKKRLKNIFITIWATGVFSFGSFLMYSDATISNSELEHFTGTISDLGTTKHYSSTKFGQRSSTVFFVKISGIDETLAVYNKDQNYDFIRNQLRVGNTISVAYKPAFKKDQPNIDTYEIIKNGEVILGQSGFRTTRLILSIVIGLVAIAFFAYGVRTETKYWRRKSTAYNRR